MSLYKGHNRIAGDGIDGFSPTVSLTKEDNKTIFSITDKNGTQTAEILDGANAEEATMALEERLKKHMLGGI